MFTTPPRPIDITSVFPEIAPLAKTATRLHPRRGIPTPGSSSVAGPMLWPEHEPWPTCQLGHLALVARTFTQADRKRLERGRQVRIQNAARMRLSLNDPGLTAEQRVGVERALLALQASLDRPEPTTVRTLQELPAERPVPLVPVIQLWAQDARELRFPDGTDLAQILWCPHSHAGVPGQPGMATGPAPILRWRDSSQPLTETTPPDQDPPSADHVLQTCVLQPEQITEYPDFEELPAQLRDRVLQWHDSFEAETGYTYRADLCTAPGLKISGWAYWPHTVRPPQCACGAGMTLMLTIPNGERGAHSWTPLEEQHVTTLRALDQSFYDPTGFDAVREQILVFSCGEDPRHDAHFAIE